MKTSIYSYLDFLLSSAIHSEIGLFMSSSELSDTKESKWNDRSTKRILRNYCSLSHILNYRKYIFTKAIKKILGNRGTSKFNPNRQYYYNPASYWLKLDNAEHWLTIQWLLLILIQFSEIHNILPNSLSFLWFSECVQIFWV